jgi:hypothetical protein
LTHPESSNKPTGTDVGKLSNKDVRDFLRAEFAFEAKQPVVSADALLLLGERSRALPEGIVDATSLEWLQEDPRSTRAEVVAWFQVGYWTDGRVPSENLLQFLTTLMGDPRINSACRDALLLVLSFAYRSRCSEEIKAQIRLAVGAVRRTITPNSLREPFRRAMEFVLSD